MNLEEAPKWVQDLIVERALGFVERLEETTIEEVDDEYALIRCGEFSYTANRRLWTIF